MKILCTEGTSLFLSGMFDVPSQEEINSGRRPSILIDATDLLNIAEQFALPEKTGLVFSVDAFELFSDGIVCAEDATATAEWLEVIAKKVRQRWGVK